jgi:hypothetical protein
MRKLWVFGCSVSDLYDSEAAKYYWSSEYLKWKGYAPKHYTQMLAEKYDCELINCAVSSTNNYQIFQDFCDRVNEITNEDYVIFQWTETTRTRFVDDNDNWESFICHAKMTMYKLNKFSHISFKTTQQVLANRLSKRYREEIESWEKLIRLKTNPHKFLVWDPFDMNGEHGKLVKSIETISDETNKSIDDPHFSENGQIKLSNILINRLEAIKKDLI